MKTVTGTPDPTVVQRQNQLSDLYTRFAVEHQDEPDYDPDDDPDFVREARRVMGLPPLAAAAQTAAVAMRTLTAFAVAELAGPADRPCVLTVSHEFCRGADGLPIHPGPCRGAKKAAKALADVAHTPAERAEPQQRKTPRARVPHAKTPTNIPDEDPVVRARQRQADIDHVRDRADLIAEAAKLIDYEATPDTLAHKLHADAQRRGIADAPEVKTLLAAADSHDTVKLQKAMRQLTKKLNVQQRGEPGQIVPFDGREMRHIGGTPARGTFVHVVRPGFLYTPQGDTEAIPIIKTDVEQATPEEIAAHRAKVDKPAARGRKAPKTTALPPPPAAPKSEQQQAAEAHVKTLTAKLPPAVRKDVEGQLLSQSQVAPKSVLSLRAIGYGVHPVGKPSNPEGTAQYHPENRSIDLNPRLRRNRKIMEADLAASQADGYLTPTGAATPLGGAIAHEFGHHVAMRFYRPDGPGVQPPAGDRIVRALATAAGVAPPRGSGRGFYSFPELKSWVQKNRAAFRTNVSSYGADSFHELLAEIWQEYSTRGPAARPMAQSVGRAMRDLAEGTARGQTASLSLSLSLPQVHHEFCRGQDGLVIHPGRCRGAKALAKAAERAVPTPAAKPAAARKAAPKPSAVVTKPAASAAQYHSTLDDVQGLADIVEHGKIVHEGKLGGGESADTRRRTYADGTKTIWKKSKTQAESDAEQLGSLVARALGLHAPRVYRNEPKAVNMDLVPGTVAGDDPKMAFGGVRPEILKSKDGRLMGLLDILTSGADRNNGNWLIRDDGRLAPIDHGFSFMTPTGQRRLSRGKQASFVSSVFGAELINVHPTYGHTTWADNEFTPQDIEEIRKRLAKLRPEFEQLKRGGWHKFMMDRLDAIQQHAKGKQSQIMPSLLGEQP